MYSGIFRAESLLSALEGSASAGSTPGLKAIPGSQSFSHKLSTKRTFYDMCEPGSSTLHVIQLIVVGFRVGIPYLRGIFHDRSDEDGADYKVFL